MHGPIFEVADCDLKLRTCPDIKCGHLLIGFDDDVVGGGGGGVAFGGVVVLAVGADAVEGVAFFGGLVVEGGVGEFVLGEGGEECGGEIVEGLGVLVVGGVVGVEGEGELSEGALRRCGGLSDNGRIQQGSKRCDSSFSEIKAIRQVGLCAFEDVDTLGIGGKFSGRDKLI